QQVPVVTIRIEKINGKTSADIKKETHSKIPAHTFSNEYRVTYRDSLTASEKILKGEWVGKAEPGKEIPISIEESFSNRNHVNIGDHLVFNVQGVSMPAVVTSVRQVNWSKIQTNFQIVFPTGVL